MAMGLPRSSVGLMLLVKNVQIRCQGYEMRKGEHYSRGIYIYIQGSRDPLARSPRRVQTMSGLVQSQRVLVRWASNLLELF